MSELEKSYEMQDGEGAIVIGGTLDEAIELVKREQSSDVLDGISTSDWQQTFYRSCDYVDPKGESCMAGHDDDLADAGECKCEKCQHCVNEVESPHSCVFKCAESDPGAETAWAISFV